ncbi:hypothetical protein L6452_26843 [Arctium lappa]|uniref:Uncharacterized protein n=1 Tax=Arctium lappa TaxID=4217 RepID=A0ACB8ZWR2_ARCLA|nr:hypothetical protein L6452_26843 [Arctium lappa]
MGEWRRGVMVGRRSAGRMKKKKAELVVLNRNDNRRSMERKLRQLQRIIPGGGGVGETDLETLFHRIAAHIFLLESRVNLLKNVHRWPLLLQKYRLIFFMDFLFIDLTYNLHQIDSHTHPSPNRFFRSLDFGDHQIDSSDVGEEEEEEDGRRWRRRRQRPTMEKKHMTADNGEEAYDGRRWYAGEEEGGIGTTKLILDPLFLFHQIDS